MTHTIEKYGDIGNFSVKLPFMNLKYVGTLAPTAKIIGDIPDFNVLNVPKMQPLHNPALAVNFWYETVQLLTHLYHLSLFVHPPILLTKSCICCVSETIYWLSITQIVFESSLPVAVQC